MELAAAAAIAVVIWLAMEAAKGQPAEQPVPVRADDDRPQPRR